MALRPNSLLLPTKDAAETGMVLVDGNRMHIVFHIQGATTSNGKVTVQVLAPSSHGEIWAHYQDISLSGAKNQKGLCISQPGAYRFVKAKTGKPVGVYSYTCGGG